MGLSLVLPILRPFDFNSSTFLKMQESLGPIQKSGSVFDTYYKLPIARKLYEYTI